MEQCNGWPRQQEDGGRQRFHCIASMCVRTLRGVAPRALQQLLLRRGSGGVLGEGAVPLQVRPAKRQAEDGMDGGVTPDAHSGQAGVPNRCQQLCGTAALVI